MVKLFVVLGLALLAGGAYAIVDGWPYLVLERGFTEVILGALAAIAGLILLALAVVLAEVRRLRGLVGGAVAAAAPPEPRHEAKPSATAEPARVEPALAKEHGAETGHVGIATTLAAGAGAAALAGALTAPARSEEQPVEPVTGDTGDEVGDDAVPAAADIPAAAELPPSETLEQVDDWLLPAVRAAPDAAPSGARADEDGEPEDIEAAAAVEDAEEIEPVAAGSDAASHPDADGESGEPELAAAAASEPGADHAPAGSDEPKPDAAPEPDTEDRLWWPRIDRPAREEAASVSDEFSALREQLVGAVNAPSAPEIAPPQRDRDALGGVGGWAAPRPWPPVTQPRDPSALPDLEVEVTAVAPAADVGPAVTVGEPAAPEPEAQDEPAQEPAPTEVAPSPAEEAAPDEKPAASEEGVIGAYQVGETQFTMYADGSIHARTPDGDYTFASMDELKAYLASEKDKLEPRAGSDQMEST